MASTARTAQLSIRLHELQKKKFVDATELCGIDPSVAARQLLELAIQRVEAGGDFLDALYELKNAWQVPRADKAA